MATTQSTFGKISVNKHSGKRRCDACTGMDKDGQPKRCSNKAHFCVLRHVTGITEFYCKTHGRDDWNDIA